MFFFKLFRLGRKEKKKEKEKWGLYDTVQSIS